jgi:cyclophilin family peptidyl-prolyl cis-trans isomerase
MLRTIKIAWIILFLLNSCAPSDKKQKQNSSEAKKEIAGQEKPSGYKDLVPAVFNIDTYENNRILESGMGFFVAEDIALTRFSFFTSANRAVIKPFDESKGYEVTEFLSVDRINDLILLRVEGFKKAPVKLADTLLNENDKVIFFDQPRGNVVPIHEGKVLSYSNVLGTKLYRVTNQMRSSSEGCPLFDASRNCIGLGFVQVADYESQTFVTPSVFISDLLKKKGKVRPLSELQNQISDANNTKIKGLLIETEYGNITIRLYNSTPQYRDNFIKLVRENYYDGLLIHRVIKGFGIQSGAADTRYSEPDDVVGWKGPGYTLPAHFAPGLYHKRGVVGAPRKPDTENVRLRSDGSQFYIVTGRLYNDKELDDLEMEMKHKFTEEQRNTYKTIGGSPHLDGTYSIFGEVISGLEVADQISLVEVKSDFRPKKDIRVKKIRILE